MKRSLQQIAEAVGARLLGDGHAEMGAVASMESATPQDLVFVEDEKHLAAALQSRAGAVIAGEFAASVHDTRPILISDHPKLAFARAARLLRWIGARGSSAAGECALDRRGSFFRGARARGCCGRTGRGLRAGND